MNKPDYTALYNIQDKILGHLANSGICSKIDVVLAGGTALARCWYQHRESDDLDFFITGNNFILDANKLIRALPSGNEIGRVQITEKYETVINLFCHHYSLSSPLKIQILQSAPPYDRDNRGNICGFPVESVRDIASDKIAALCDRRAPKDMADLYQIVTSFECGSFASLVSEAVPKGIGISLLGLAQAIDRFDYSSLESIVWKRSNSNEPSDISIDIWQIQKTMKEFVRTLVLEGDTTLPFYRADLRPHISPRRPG